MGDEKTVLRFWNESAVLFGSAGAFRGKRSASALRKSSPDKWALAPGFLITDPQSSFSAL
jgi:hypothetical protein